MNQIIDILGDSYTPNFRTGFEGDGQVFDGVTTELKIHGWNELEVNQPFTFLVAATIHPQNIQNATRFFSTITNSSTNSGFVLDTIRSNDRVQASFSENLSGDRINFRGVVNYQYNKIVFIYSYAGDIPTQGTSADIKVWNNSFNCPISSFLPQGIPSTIINGNNESLIGSYQSSTSAGKDYYSIPCLFRMQQINKALTPEEAREAFNTSTLRGIVSDSDFLIDPKFNSFIQDGPIWRVEDLAGIYNDVPGNKYIQALGTRVNTNYYNS